MQVGDALGAVLPPVPERERRLPVDLRREGAVPERAHGVDRIRLEEEDRERRERRDREADHEADLRPALPPVRVGEPERRDDQGRELRPGRQGAEDPALDRRGGEPEAEDQEGGDDRVVRV